MKGLEDAKQPYMAESVIGDSLYTIELATPVFKNKKQARDYWNTVEPIPQKAGLIKESEYVTTGAGHLNVDTKSHLHTWKLFRDFNARPYIAWAFNDLADDQYAVNYFTRHERDFWGKLDPTDMDVVPMLDCTENDRIPSKIIIGTAKFCGMHIRGCNNWVEFRPFSAARDWKEQEAHLDFIQAYMQWVYDRPILEKMPFLSKEAMQAAFTADSAAAAFKQLIADLGLKWERYAEYEEVLRYRFTMDKRYLC